MHDVARPFQRFEFISGDCWCLIGQFEMIWTCDMVWNVRPAGHIWPIKNVILLISQQYVGDETSALLWIHAGRGATHHVANHTQRHTGIIPLCERMKGGRRSVVRARETWSPIYRQACREKWINELKRKIIVCLHVSDIECLNESRRPERALEAIYNSCLICRSTQTTTSRNLYF